MTPASSHPTSRRILFVDDDTAFLQALGELFGHRSAGRWQIHLAETTGRALSILQEKHIDLVVIDIQMPVVDGEQFLQLLNRRYPNLRKVVMSGFASSEHRASCLNNGAELFLEKPRSADGFESVFATLDELVTLQAQTGFRGLLRQVGLQDVLQMECLGRSSSVLEIATTHTRGRIFIKNGLIIHAEVDERKGEDALNYLLALRGGDFSLKPFQEPTENTIQGQWESLLMEAARQRDEAAEQDPNPADHPEDCDALASLGQTYGSETGTPVYGAVSPHPVSGPALPPCRVNEFLVCSAQGEVLHQWQCANIDARFKLFDFICQRSNQLAPALALGRLDRFEVRTAESRLVVQVRSDRRLLVVSSPLSDLEG